MQGIAEVDDRDLDANRERYGRESLEKLPATADQLPPKPLRRMFRWYFNRIYVHVRPERVYVWRDGDVAREPELFDAHLEEVRSGHVEEPLDEHAPTRGASPAWDERLDELGQRYPQAVVSLVSPDGFPFSVRVPITVDPGARRIRLGGAPGGRSLAARPGVRDRARPRARLQLAAQLPGARRSRGGERRLGGGAAAAGGRLRAAARLHPPALPGQRPQGAPVPQDRPG